MRHPRTPLVRAPNGNILLRWRRSGSRGFGAGGTRGILVERRKLVHKSPRVLDSLEDRFLDVEASRALLCVAAEHLQPAERGECGVLVLASLELRGQALRNIHEKSNVLARLVLGTPLQGRSGYPRVPPNLDTQTSELLGKLHGDPGYRFLIPCDGLGESTAREKAERERDHGASRQPETLRELHEDPPPVGANCGGHADALLPQVVPSPGEKNPVPPEHPASGRHRHIVGCRPPPGFPRPSLRA